MSDNKKDEKLEIQTIEDQEFLERYLAGEAPLHAERLNLPSEEELDASEAEFDKILATSKLAKRRNLTVALWIASIAAVLVLAFIIWPKQDVEESPSLVVNDIIKDKEKERSEQPTLSSNIESKAILAEAKDEPKAQRAEQSSRKLKNTSDIKKSKEERSERSKLAAASSPKANNTNVPATKEVVEPQEPVRIIPRDKQALADIYLAEMVLQVAYEQQAQQEAIRAYAASLTGEEMPESIITF